VIIKTIANCLFSALLALPAVVQSKQPTIPLDSLRLNQIQIIATHNSYHLRPDPSIYRLLRFFYALGLLPADLNPQGIDYAKAPITTQLDQQGVRGLELDIYYDPKGGLYYHRVGMSLCLKRSGSGVDALRKPGFKILHIPDFDFNTTNYTLVRAGYRSAVALPLSLVSLSLILLAKRY
jgi:hypothetical protein